MSSGSQASLRVQDLDGTAAYGNPPVVLTAVDVSEQLQHAAVSQLDEPFTAVSRQGVRQPGAQQHSSIGQTSSGAPFGLDDCPVGPLAPLPPYDFAALPGTSFGGGSDDRSSPLLRCSPAVSPLPTGPDSSTPLLGDCPEFVPPQPMLWDHQPETEMPGSPSFSLETQQDQRQPLPNEHRRLDMGAPQWVSAPLSIPMQCEMPQERTWPSFHQKLHADLQTPQQDLQTHGTHPMFQPSWQREHDGSVHSESPPPSAAYKRKRLSLASSAPLASSSPAAAASPHMSADCEDEAPATASPQFHPTRSGLPSATRDHPFLGCPVVAASGNARLVICL